MTTKRKRVIFKEDGASRVLLKVLPSKSHQRRKKEKLARENKEGLSDFLGWVGKRERAMHAFLVRPPHSLMPQ